MANPTTNYGFVLPTSSDLVTDLPADFDVALQGVDTRLKALQPGTTLGDLAYSSATANTNTRLGIGSTGQVLTVSGGVPTWATAGSAANFELINAGGTALTGAATITVSGISGKNSLMIWVDQASSASASSYFNFRFNTDSGSNYRWAGLSKQNVTMQEVRTAGSSTEIEWSRLGTSAANTVTGFIQINGANAAGQKPFSSSSAAAGGTPGDSTLLLGTYIGSSAISSVSIISSVGNFDAGTIYVYGA